jgi:hypothetical protein
VKECRRLSSGHVVHGAGCSGRVGDGRRACVAAAEFRAATTLAVLAAWLERDERRVVVLRCVGAGWAATLLATGTRIIAGETLADALAQAATIAAFDDEPKPVVDG